MVHNVQFVEYNRVDNVSSQPVKKIFFQKGLVLIPMLQSGDLGIS